MEGGVIDRDETGRPLGIFRENARACVLDAIPEETLEGVKELIVDTAITNKLGARGLRSICEQIFDDAMFDAPSSGKKTFTVTLEYARKKLENNIRT